MSIGAFTEKNRQPTQTQIAEMLGAMLQPWQALAEHIRADYRAKEVFRFCYCEKYGWALTFRLRGNLFTALYPARNAFVVQIILNPAALQQAEALALGDAARQAMARAKPWPEGKWLFISVQSEQDLRDVQSLLALKAAALSRKKAAAR